MQPRLPTKTMMGTPSNAADCSSSRGARVDKPWVNRPCTRRRLCWRSAPNFLSMPKNACVSCSAAQASPRPATSIAASGWGAGAGTAGVKTAGLVADAKRCTTASNAARSVVSRWKILCTARPWASKNCRLTRGRLCGLAASSVTANPACHWLKNRRRSMSSPSASPIGPMAESLV